MAIRCTKGSQSERLLGSMRTTLELTTLSLMFLRPVAYQCQVREFEMMRNSGGMHHFEAFVFEVTSPCLVGLKVWV
jgi:hypothetical protein